MRFTIRRMMLAVVCVGIACYWLRFVSDPEFGYRTNYSKRYSETGFKSLRIDMTSEEVVAIIGHPLGKLQSISTIYPGAGDDETWLYSEPRYQDDKSFWRRRVIFKKGTVVGIVNEWYFD